MTAAGRRPGAVPVPERGERGPYTAMLKRFVYTFLLVTPVGL